MKMKTTKIQLKLTICIKKEYYKNGKSKVKTNIINRNQSVYPK